VRQNSTCRVTEFSCYFHAFLSDWETFHPHGRMHDWRCGIFRHPTLNTAAAGCFRHKYSNQHFIHGSQTTKLFLDKIHRSALHVIGCRVTARDQSISPTGWTFCYSNEIKWKLSSPFDVDPWQRRGFPLNRPNVSLFDASNTFTAISVGFNRQKNFVW